MKSCSPYQNLGQIDHNLHNHVFDDVICKPSTDYRVQFCVLFKSVYYCQFKGLFQKFCHLDYKTL